MSKIKIVICEPEKEPKVVEIENELEPMQQIVGGYIEVVRPSVFENGILLICNEEGMLDDLPKNRGIHGIFFITKDGGEDFISLTDKEVETVIRLTKHPKIPIWGGNGFEW
jgi:hypothetical protein